MLYLFRLLRNNLYPVTFLLLLGIAVSQILRFNLYQKTFYFNSSKRILGSAAQVQNSVSGYFNLQEVNKSLAEQNLALLNSKGFNVYVDTTVTILKDSAGVARYSYQVARVIKSTSMQRNNFVTIDKGSTSGITKGMAVVSPSGIVGLVYDVSDNFALVLSVLNSKFVTTPMIPEIGFREGSVTWNGQDPELAQLNFVSKFEVVKPGMKVLTSNFSLKFPAGIPIGTIKTVKKKATSSFYDIQIKLATNFNKLDYVYVVRDNFRPQLDSLEIKEEVQDVP